MKIKLELNIPDERIFLNFWNSYNGDAVLCEIKNGKLMLSQRDDDANELPSKEITLIQFCEMVKSRQQNIQKSLGDERIF